MITGRLSVLPQFLMARVRSDQQKVRQKVHASKPEAQAEGNHVI